MSTTSKGAVHDALTGLGVLAAILLVEVRGRRIVDEGRGDDVIRLRHGAANRMLELLSDGEIFEVKAGYGGLRGYSGSIPASLIRVPQLPNCCLTNSPRGSRV